MIRLQGMYKHLNCIPLKKGVFLVFSIKSLFSKYKSFNLEIYVSRNINKHMVDNCPKCNSSNTGNQFCPTCGFQLNTWESTNQYIEQKPTPTKTNNHCIKCSYSITPKHRSCPNCGEIIKGEDSLSDTGQMQERVSSKHYSSPVLRAVSLENVKHQDLILNLDTHIINRQLIDPSDKSISVDEHAVIYKEDGNWYISNKASNKALFVQIGQDLKLTDGTLLLLGNSKFYKFQI